MSEKPVYKRRANMREDTPEQIEICLNCQQQKCTNCLVQNPTGKKKGRRKKPVIAFREGEEDMYFDSADEAGEFFHVVASAVRRAACYGKICCDYFWRYDE